jgi:Ca-activated chloride channel family protein
VLALAWLLFAMAMAGPRIAENDYKQDKENYTELMVVLDVSRSMTARDVAPSRLERAKLELQDLIARAERQKIGLVVYAARAHLMIPPTDDKTVLRHALQVLRYGLLPTEGSNLQGAIEFASKHFTSEQSARALLLVSDGEISTNDATAEARLDDMVSQLAQQGVSLYALGIGTPEGAPLLAQQGGWLRYRNEAVVSKLHEDRLQELAVLGNGRYSAVSETDAEWQKLYDKNIKYLHTADTIRKGDRLIEWRELYGWCLIPAALLMLLTYVEPRRGSLGTSHLLWFAVFVISGWLNPPLAHASDESWQQRAYQAYSNKSYLEAKQGYARVAGYGGRMGEGSSAYRLGEYQEAVQLFTQAILDADNDARRARAVFNLANSHYQLEDYGAAVTLYREVLRYAPNNQAAQLNLDFAIAMQKQQQRDGDSGGSGRQGRGPRTTQPPEGTDVTSGNLSIDDEDDAKPPPIPAIPDSQPLPDSDLIAQGIFHSRLAVQQATEFKDPTWHYAATSVERIVLQANSLKVDESILWKRIFEAEEDFPAPVETPRELPDMTPW